ncbi:BRO-N domain-containing protein [Streptomyces sp. 6N223]|uniref:BRO-N domain-containing protein n=1 Tax=Streptomyces sp. 6N223 TaxID=3457412 RepID=UPI003FD2AB9F
MSEEHTRDAIDINDFVYAATGARVRRLTLPNGEHWFPATDVCKELGHTNTTEALRRHVPEDMRSVVRTLISREGLIISAGHGLRESMILVSLKGLIRLVNGCVKRECEPFKNWIADVLVTVQREGSYSLERAEVQPAGPQAPTAYAMPQQVADAIVRLEERNLRIDEELAAAQREANRSRQETVNVMKDTSRNLSRVADALEKMVDRLPTRDVQEESARLSRQPSVSAPGSGGMTAEQLLASWRARVTITEDVWSVAVLLAPALAERGETRLSIENIADRTGLTTARVHDSLRFLLKRQCIRQIGTIHDAPVYALHHA